MAHFVAVLMYFKNIYRSFFDFVYLISKFSIISDLGAKNLAFLSYFDYISHFFKTKHTSFGIMVN